MIQRFIPSDYMIKLNGTECAKTEFVKLSDIVEMLEGMKKEQQGYFDTGKDPTAFDCKLILSEAISRLTAKE